MEKQLFQRQIERLQSEWRNSYGAERIAALWNTYKNTPDDLFARAVTRCLLSCRGAPLVEELTEAMDAIRREDEQLRAYRPGFDDFASAVMSIETNALNRAFAKECKRVLERYHKGEISKEDFHKHCDLLDEAAKLGAHECEHCVNTGYVVKPDSKGTNALHRCKCRLGSIRPHEIAAPAQKDGSKEMVLIPQWQGEVV